MTTGAKPKCVTHLGECLMDVMAVLMDDARNEERILEDFKEALEDDGVIDLEEACEIWPRLQLGRELTGIEQSLSYWGNRSYEQVVVYIDEYRTRESRKPLESGSQHP